jgi:hypothetical protein
MRLLMKNAYALCLGFLLVFDLTASGAEFQRLSREELRDKIRGAWAGQMIGVSYGARTEFRAQGEIFGKEIQPDALSNAIHQDDLYVEMTFAKVMDTKGLNATPLDYGIAFRDSQYSLWHANAGARRNLARGIMPPLSGRYRFPNRGRFHWHHVSRIAACVQQVLRPRRPGDELR